MATVKVTSKIADDRTEELVKAVGTKPSIAGMSMAPGAYGAYVWQTRTVAEAKALKQKLDGVQDIQVDIHGLV